MKHGVVQKTPWSFQCFTSWYGKPALGSELAAELSVDHFSDDFHDCDRNLLEHPGKRVKVIPYMITLHRRRGTKSRTNTPDSLIVVFPFSDYRAKMLDHNERTLIPSLKLSCPLKQPLSRGFTDFRCSSLFPTLFIPNFVHSH